MSLTIRARVPGADDEGFLALYNRMAAEFPEKPVLTGKTWSGCGTNRDCAEHRSDDRTLDPAGFSGIIDSMNRQRRVERRWNARDM
jgi:hypothetical protein